MRINAAVLCPANNLRHWNCSRCSALDFASPSDVTIWEADNRALLSLVGVSHEQRRIYEEPSRRVSETGLSTPNFGKRRGAQGQVTTIHWSTMAF
jgi:hypothetical protein